ncbi:MAG: tetratricopeptide repeat protein [Phycisphaerales bacterium]|nr:tetratricopeptide repeat protein [Phycisphaerales bacterium]
MAVRRYIVTVATLATLGTAAYVSMSPPKSFRVVTSSVQPTTAPAASGPAESVNPKQTLLQQVDKLKAAIRETPDQILLHIQLGELLTELQQTADAVKVLSDAFDRFVVRGVGSATPKDKIHLRAAFACAVLKSNDVRRAWQLAKEALDTDQRDVQANVAMGKVLTAAQQFDAADKHFDLASILSRDDNDMLCNILCDWGEMLLIADRSQDAEVKFRQAARLKQQEAKCYLWLGRALRQQGRFGPAIQSEETARELSPKMSEPCVELGAIYMELKEYAKSERYFRAALAVEPGNIAASTRLAHLLIATDDPAQRNYLEAAMLLGNAVELTGGRDVNLLTQQAAALALGEYYEQAKACMEKAIAAAKEQNMPGETRELLLQTVQQYAYLQNEAERKASGEQPQSRPANNEPVLPDDFLLPQSPLDPHPYIVPPSAPLSLSPAQGQR